MSWYTVENGARGGPFTPEELRERVVAGAVGAETLVWSEGMPGWQPFGAVAPDPGLLVPSASCGECGRRLPLSELFRHGPSHVCGECKPLFLQKLREGVPPVAASSEMHYAGFWIRLLAHFIDRLLLGIVSFGLSMGMVGLVTKASTRFEAVLAVQLILIGIQTAIDATYQTLMVGRYGGTLGKLALRLRVVAADGKPVGYATALGRFFAAMVSGLILGIGYVMAAFDDEKRTLHDRICSTRVVRV